MKTTRNHSNKLRGLQALRFTAAALVIWAHLRFSVGPSSNQLVNSSVGAVGVDLFFVISGFVIALSASRLDRNYRLFFAHRIARVVPLYYILTALILMKEAFKTGTSGTFQQIWNSFLFLPLFDLGSYTSPYHGYGWTLSFEIWFYLAFGSILAFLGAVKARIILPFFLAAGVLLCFFFYDGQWYLPRFIFHPIVLEFCAGILLFHFREKFGKKTLFVFLTLFLLFLPGVFLTADLGHHGEVLASPLLGMIRTAVWGGFSVCFVGAVICLEEENILFIPNWLVGLGDSSYSIYLIQPFAIKLTVEILPDGGIAGGVAFVAATIFGGLGFTK